MTLTFSNDTLEYIQFNFENEEISNKQLIFDWTQWIIILYHVYAITIFLA